MLSIRSLSASLLLVALIVGDLWVVSNAKRVTLIDEEGTEEIEKIAKVVCETTKGVEKQLSRVSSVAKLADYLRSLPKGHKLAKCGDKYLGAVERLVEVVQVGNENVCSERKLELIENYHRDFVSEVAKFKATRLEVPKVVRLLFLQYASLVSTLCEKEAVKLVERYDPEAESADKALEAELDDAMRHFLGAVGLSGEQQKSYDGIFLVWNLIDSLPLEKSEKLARYVQARGQATRLHVQLHDPSGMHSLQKFCRSMRPTYGATLLPVLRLIDLGYYPIYSQLPEILNLNVPFRRKYTLVQMCETLLPIKFYASDSLKQGQVSLLSREDAESLPEPAAETLGEEAAYVPKHDLSHLSLVGQDVVGTVNKDQAAQLAADVKLQVKSRAEAMGRALKIVILNMKRQMKSRRNELFLGSGSDGQDLETLLEDAGLNELDESELADGARHKRSKFHLSESKKKYLIKLAKGAGMALLQFGKDMVEGLLVVLGGLFLLAVKVADVLVVLIYRLWRHISGGRGYRPLEKILECAWNSGYTLTKKPLDLYDADLDYMGEGGKRHKEERD